MRYELCKIADVPATGSRVVPFFGREVHVYRADGAIRAAANVCLHFGGSLECKNDRFCLPVAWRVIRLENRGSPERSRAEGRKVALPVDANRR